MTFRHCLRDVNRVAHNLAKYVHDPKSVVMLDGDPSSFLLSDMVNDATST